MRKVNRPIESTHEFFEALEARLALYTSPLLADLPTIDEMSSPMNTVVRLSTSAGAIDIELYDREGPDDASPAPITTANFLRYISSGRYEQTFFHRLAANFVLQGGGYAFTPPSTSTAVQTFGNVDNEFDAGRSNIERTIAMAKLGGDPDSATSQFFFNLGDNASNLNNQNGGFTVFGRVIQGWEVVQTIAGFQTRDLDQFFTGSNPAGNGLYDAVPISGTSNSDVVTIVDAEVIKPAGQSNFFITALYYPEGYRAVQITSNVNLLNEDVNDAVSYEIIARFEIGSRDKVITSGTLAPGARITIPVSEGGNPQVDNVRPYTPFAYEIRATGAVAATLEHHDFGAVASGAFIDPMQLTADQLRSWTFADGLQGPGIPSFLVWESLAGEAATLTIRFFSDTGDVSTITRTLQPYRRGGLNLNDLPIVPSGLFSIHIASTQPIVAALSQYRAIPGRASTELGMHDSTETGGGSGATEAVLPGAVIPSDGQSLLSLVYTGSAASVNVSISFILADGTVLDGGTETLTSGTRRRDYDLSVLNGALPQDEFFTIRYSVSGSEKVGGGYTSITAGDTIRTAFQSGSTGDIFFAGGYTDPTSSGREVISLFNPYAGTSTEVTYRLRFQFVESDGDEVIYTDTATLGARTDIDITTLQAIMNRINSGTQFRRYSITVETDITNGGSSINGAIFGQLTRIGMSGNTVTYNPTLSHTQQPQGPVGNVT